MREKSGQHVLHVSFRRVPAVYTQQPPLRREVFVLDCPVPRMPEAVPVQTTAMSQPVRHGITRMTAPRKQHALLFVVFLLVWPKPWRGGCQQRATGPLCSVPPCVGPPNSLVQNGT